MKLQAPTKIHRDNETGEATFVCTHSLCRSFFGGVCPHFQMCPHCRRLRSCNSMSNGVCRAGKGCRRIHDIETVGLSKVGGLVKVERWTAEQTQIFYKGLGDPMPPPPEPSPSEEEGEEPAAERDAVDDALAEALAEALADAVAAVEAKELLQGLRRRGLR